MDKLYPSEAIVNPNELGKLKLEGVYKRAIFLAPKCYALEDLVASVSHASNVTYKVKGLIKNVSLSMKHFFSSCKSVADMLRLTSTSCNVRYSLLAAKAVAANAAITLLLQDSC